MLVLNRKVGEEIVIGDSIRLVIVDVHGRNVRLGFEAPREVPILRSEVRDEIQKAAPQQQASLPVPSSTEITCPTS